jgi:hypothetical protein
MSSGNADIVKWRQVLVVDSEYRVTAVVETFF